MKRFIGALLIAGLLFFMTVFAENKMENSCSDMSLALEICANHLRNKEYDRALETLDSIDVRWHENEFIMGVVTGDITFRSAGIDINTVYDCINDKNYSQALLIIREIQSCFKQVIEDRRLTIGNIL